MAAYGLIRLALLLLRTFIRVPLFSGMVNGIIQHIAMYGQEQKLQKTLLVLTLTMVVMVTTLPLAYILARVGLELLQNTAVYLVSQFKEDNICITKL
jgi:ABC-type sulfate transport system permease subunit